MVRAWRMERVPGVGMAGKADSQTLFLYLALAPSGMHVKMAALQAMGNLMRHFATKDEYVIVLSQKP